MRQVAHLPINHQELIRNLIELQLEHENENNSSYK